MARSCASDPLEKFRFSISWSADGDSNSTTLVRLGFHDVQMPKRTTNKIAYREGLDADVSAQSPGLSTMEDIVMSRGVIIEDVNDEFYQWAKAIHNPTQGLPGREALKARASDAATNKIRKDITIQMLDREGNVARQWTIYQAWIVNFVPGSDLNASEDGEKSMEQITVAYEDFRELDLQGNAR